MTLVRKLAKRHNSTSRLPASNIRVMLMLLMPLLLVAAVLEATQPTAMRAATLARGGIAAPDISPPSNLQIVTLDSSFHVTWDPSTDPLTAWHVVSVWSGSTLRSAKVTGRTGRAIQTNGLNPGESYTVKVQAMDAQGNLSTAISADATTDPQSPMRNAAFFENFNEAPGDLDYNYFDVRTSHNDGLRPDSLGLERFLVFNNENHFHTQMISGVQRGELYIRPRVPFDFAGRTGTFQFEVDTAPVQHSEGKWFEIHLARDIPWSSQEFGAGRGDDFPDSIEFSVREGNDTDATINIPQITVNIGGNVLTYIGNARQVTPANIRMPVVLKVSQTSAEMFINGVSVVRATGFNLPFTTGYWFLAHRAWYASRDLHTTPVIVQLIHWETIQFDGPNGSFNPIVKTYLQPGCGGVVHNEHDSVVGCSRMDFSPSARNHTMSLNIADDMSQGRSAKLLYNGNSSNASLTVSINGHQANVPTKTCCYFETLNSFDFPANWLQTGNNQITFTYTGGGSADIIQAEIEVVFNQQRVMQNIPMEPMPMLSVTGQNFRVDHLTTDPNIYTATTYLYSLGSADPISYNAQVATSDTPWLTVSPATGVLQSPALGGGMRPLVLSVNFNGLTTDSDGEVGAIKITGGNMPVYVGVLVVADGSNTRPQFITTFTNLNTTFNKNAIPDYHGASGSPTATPVVTPPPTNTSAPTSTSVPTGSPAPTNTPRPTSTPASTTTSVPTGSPAPTNTSVPTGSPAPTNTSVPTGSPAPTNTPQPTPCTSFSDVPSSYWAYQYINYLVCHSIISGYADGTFRPGNLSTRGQIAKMVVLGEGWPIDTTNGPHFSDVPTTHAFYGYIETAYHHNIISGYAGGTFRPSDNATRAQFCKVLYLALTNP